MKPFVYLRKSTASLMFLLVLISFSCSKESDNQPEPEPEEKKPEMVMLKEIIANNLIAYGQEELAAKVKYNVAIYKYSYPMTYRGDNITLSGLIGVPVAKGEFPLLSFQHGTLVAKTEAPSESIFTSSIYTLAAALGYVVCLPDLIGFGESEAYFHPFLVKQANVEAISGMIASVKNTPYGNWGEVSVNDSLFLLGYSQGGWLTLSQLEYMEQKDDLNMNLIAASCGAGPYNPEQVMKYTMNQETYGKPFYLAYVFLSYLDNESITSGLDTYFKEPYATTIPDLFDGINTGLQIDAALTTTMSDFYSDDFVANYSSATYNELRSVLNENSIQAWQNSTPVLFIHGESDTYIPVELSDSIYSKFIQVGSTKVEKQTLPLLDHNTAAVPSIAEALLWFENLRTKQNVIALK